MTRGRGGLLRDRLIAEWAFIKPQQNTGRFIIFSVITNIYCKKTKGPTLMELFTATGKLKKRFFFRQLEMFDVSPVVHTSNISSCPLIPLG